MVQKMGWAEVPKMGQKRTFRAENSRKNDKICKMEKDGGFREILTPKVIKSGFWEISKSDPLEVPKSTPRGPEKV